MGFGEGEGLLPTLLLRPVERRPDCAELLKNTTVGSTGEDIAGWMLIRWVGEGERVETREDNVWVSS